MNIVAEVKITAKDNQTYYYPITISDQDIEDVIIKKATKIYDLLNVRIMKFDVNE